MLKNLIILTRKHILLRIYTAGTNHSKIFIIIDTGVVLN